MTFISCTNSSYFSVIFSQFPYPTQYLLSFLQRFSFMISLQHPWLGSLFLDPMFSFWFIYSGCWNQSQSKQLRTIEWEYRFLEWLFLSENISVRLRLHDRILGWTPLVGCGALGWWIHLAGYGPCFLSHISYIFSLCLPPHFPIIPNFFSTFFCTLEYFLKFLELILIPNIFSFPLSFYFLKFIVFRLEIYRYMKLRSNLKASFYSWKIWDASIEGNWKVSTELGSVKFLVTWQLVVSLDSVYNRSGNNSKQVANDLRVTGNKKWRWKLQMWSSIWHRLVKSSELEWWLSKGKQLKKKKPLNYIYIVFLFMK